MGSDNLCLYAMPDGSIKCTSCNHPPANSVYRSAAPEGLSEGDYHADDPRLNEGGEVLPESGGEV